MAVRKTLARFAWELVKAAATELASNAGREAGEALGKKVGSKFYTPPKEEAEEDE